MHIKHSSRNVSFQSVVIKLEQAEFKEERDQHESERLGKAFMEEEWRISEEAEEKRKKNWFKYKLNNRNQKFI